MKKYMALFFVFLHGCATITTSGMLYNAYSEYRHKLNKQNVSYDYQYFFHPNLTKSANTKDSSVLSQLLFHGYMAEELEHYEKIHGNKGCLTVNGIDSNKNMVAFYIEYKNHNNKWLISDINVSFIDESMNYSQKALCPNQTRVH